MRKMGCMPAGPDKAMKSNAHLTSNEGIPHVCSDDLMRVDSELPLLQQEERVGICRLVDLVIGDRRLYNGNGSCQGHPSSTASYSPSRPLVHAGCVAPSMPSFTLPPPEIPQQRLNGTWGSPPDIPTRDSTALELPIHSSADTPSCPLDNNPIHSSADKPSCPLDNNQCTSTLSEVSPPYGTTETLSAWEPKLFFSPTHSATTLASSTLPRLVSCSSQFHQKTAHQRHRINRKDAFRGRSRVAHLKNRRRNHRISLFSRHHSPVLPGVVVVADDMCRRDAKAARKKKHRRDAWKTGKLSETQKGDDGEIGCGVPSSSAAAVSSLASSAAVPTAADCSAVVLASLSSFPVAESMKENCSSPTNLTIPSSQGSFGVAGVVPKDADIESECLKSTKGKEERVLTALRGSKDLFEAHRNATEDNSIASSFLASNPPNFPPGRHSRTSAKATRAYALRWAHPTDSQGPRWLRQISTISFGVGLKASTLGPAAGLGLFAKKIFYRGEYITEFVGPHITKERAEELRQQGKSSHIISLDFWHAYVDGIKVPEVAVGGASFANDGTKGLGGPGNNATFVRWDDNLSARRRIFLRAKKDIECNEEIFVSYATTYWELKERELIKAIETEAKIKRMAEAADTKKTDVVVKVKGEESRKRKKAAKSKCEVRNASKRSADLKAVKGKIRAKGEGHQRSAKEQQAEETVENLQVDESHVMFDFSPLRDPDPSVDDAVCEELCEEPLSDSPIFFDFSPLDCRPRHARSLDDRSLSRRSSTSGGSLMSRSCLKDQLEQVWTILRDAGDEEQETRTSATDVRLCQTPPRQQGERGGAAGDRGVETLCYVNDSVETVMFSWSP